MMLAPSVFGEYWDAVAQGDSGTATAVAYRELDAGASVIDLLEDLVCAAQAQVGNLWALNEWNIAQEHRATSVGEDVVGALAAGIAGPGAGRHVVIACTDGEWHALPSRVLGAALRSAGHRVSYLGASVPVRHFAQLVHETGPDVTAVSCALSTRLFEARRMIEVSREAGIPVLVGGRGFGPGGRWAATLGADAWAPDARGAVAAMQGDALPSFTTGAPPLPAPDDSIEELRRRCPEIVAAGVQVMRARMPDVASYDDEQVRRTAEDIGHIIEFLCAALFVDDVRLFTDFVDWLRAILVARGVPSSTLRRGLHLVAQVIQSRPGPYDRVLRFLAHGADAVGDAAA